MIFELHCHTHYSRGTKIPAEVMMSPKEAVRAAGKAGIGGLAITDHRVVSGWREAGGEARRLGMAFIPGQEIESLGGHIIGLGLSEQVRNRMSVGDTLDAIHDQGGLSVAPHPYDIKNDGLKGDCLRADAVEVFNSLVLDRVSNWQARRQASNSGVPMVVGSDAHAPGMIGLSVNIADAHDMDSLFREVRQGRIKFRTSYVPASQVVSWVRQRMSCSYDDIMVYIEHNYPPAKAWVSRQMLRKFVGSSHGAWDMLGRFAIGCSAVYSGVKLLTY